MSFGDWIKGGWTRGVDVFMPGVGTAYEQAKKANDRNETELNRTGISAPSSQYSPQNIDPSLQKGQGMRPERQYTSGPSRVGGMGAMQGSGQQTAGALRGGQMDGIMAKPHDGQTTTQAKGWDMTGPGASEQFWQKNQDRVLGASQTEQAYDQHKNTFAGPGQGEQYWNQVQGKFNDPVNAQAAYNRANNRSDDPGLGAYYDRAKKETADGMTNQLAAMGMYGSSVGAQKMGNALSGLDAERANREADYVMRQDQLVGQLAGQADSQNQSLLGLGGQMSNNAQQLGQSRAQAGLGAATAVDSADLSRFNSGAQAAAQAQDARRARTQDAFGNIFAPANAMSNAVGQAQNGIIENDQQLIDGAAAAEMGWAADAVDNSRYKADRQKDDERHAANMTDWFMSKFAGGGGGGGMGGMMGGGGG